MCRVVAYGLLYKLTINWLDIHINGLYTNIRIQRLVHAIKICTKLGKLSMIPAKLGSKGFAEVHVKANLYREIYSCDIMLTYIMEYTPITAHTKYTIQEHTATLPIRYTKGQLQVQT